MSDKLIASSTEESLTAVIGAEGFDRLSEDTKKLVIAGVTNNRGKDGGFMGRFFGHKKENAAMHIAFVLCILLAIIGLICLVLGKDYWNVIIPAITTGMGYMFGKGDK